MMFLSYCALIIKSQEVFKYEKIFFPLCNLIFALFMITFLYGLVPKELTLLVIIIYVVFSVYQFNYYQKLAKNKK
ncbi:hypothetical protein SAMN03080614_11101 [Anaerobranca gottschalkii DSM 13577]|uniref:Uncharacterized protein n=1 Tax=Anaerobranca gottschalkii DSM 13577 TaxID=1120990 RepID=A0A1I0CZD1_9FIRM|nr:hypothetical protein SAMN03080614_11101 [Anaerobranca gottschalkii DSM 13577]